MQLLNAQGDPHLEARNLSRLTKLGVNGAIILPVSDAETVLVKFVTAMVVLPLLVLVLAVLLQPLVSGIAALRVPTIRSHLGELVAGGVTALPRVLGIQVFSVLWYAPLAAYLMLASVVAKRMPLMYAVMPPITLGIAEILLFRTPHVFEFVANRLEPWPARISLVYTATEHGWSSLSSDWWRLYLDPGLWLGLVTAAAMLYAVIRLRRYRDDT